MPIPGCAAELAIAAGQGRTPLRAEREQPLAMAEARRHGMLTRPGAEGATGAAAGGGRKPQGAFQARQGQVISGAAPAAAPDRRFRQLCSLGAGPCLLTLPHSANTQLGLGMHLAHLILAVFLGQLLGTTGQILVTQEDGPVTLEQGHTFHTTCKYQTSNFNGLLWYQLRKGQGPQLLSYQAGTGPKHSGRITTHLNTTGKSSVLKVQQVELSDSALYLCAVQDSRYNKLTFGSGTRLNIQPKVTPSPSVYRLTSKDDQDLEMCLITDYSPDKLTVNSAEQHTSAVVGVAKEGSPEESSYLSTYWARRDQLQCAASHEGFGELEGDDPESGASAVCVTGMSLNFKTNEHLNTMSLSQLGLKVVLMKGVIFNVLMTMLLWKKKKD